MTISRVPVLTKSLLDEFILWKDHCQVLSSCKAMDKRNFFFISLRALRKLLLKLSSFVFVYFNSLFSLLVREAFEDVKLYIWESDEELSEIRSWQVFFEFYSLFELLKVIKLKSLHFNLLQVLFVHVVILFELFIKSLKYLRITPVFCKPELKEAHRLMLNSFLSKFDHHLIESNWATTFIVDFKKLQHKIKVVLALLQSIL